MKIKNILTASSAACALFFTSCGEDPIKAAKGVDKTTLSTTQVVEQWKKDVEEGKVASLWDSLPKSYQDELEGMVHKVGGNMDADVYNEAFKTLTAANNLLKSKKAIILEISDVELGKMSPDIAKGVNENYDAIVDLMGTILASDLKTAEGMKTMKIEKFLAEIQPKLEPIMKAAMATQKEIDLKSFKVEAVSDEADKAKVKVTAGNKPTVELELVKLEERWIPADMQKAWKDMLKDGNKAISMMEKNAS